MVTYRISTQQTLLLKREFQTLDALSRAEDQREEARNKKTSPRKKRLTVGEGERECDAEI